MNKELLIKLLRDKETNESSFIIGVLEITHLKNANIDYVVEYISKFDEKWKMKYKKNITIDIDTYLKYLRDKRIDDIIS